MTKGFRPHNNQRPSSPRPQVGSGDIVMPEAPPILLGTIRGRVRVSSGRWQTVQQLNQTVNEEIARARSEAEQLLAVAREEAQRVLDMAKASAEEIRAQAWAEGHAEGLAAGRKEGLASARAEVAEHLHTVYRLADAAADARVEMLRKLEPEIVELVLDMAAKVIGESIRLNPTLVVDVVSQAVRQASTTEQLRIRVNPADVEQLESYWAEALKDNPSGRHWEIVADRHIQPGGCIVDTPSGTVDARIETQLLQIRNSFLPEGNARECDGQ